MTFFSRMRRKLLAGLVGVSAVTLSVAAITADARAQGYANGPVQIIVSYGAGGGTDRLARLLAEPLSAELGVPVTVQNMPGAGGQVAAAAMLREKPDGQIIWAGNQPDLYMGPVIEGAPYKVEDLQVIMVDLIDPRVMLVQADSDIETLADFVEKAKAEPGKLAVSVSQGSAQELFAKWLFGELGIDVRLVGYQGGSKSANALVAGEVVATIGDDFARTNLRDQTKALLVAAEQESPRWPEAQTLVAALEPFDIAPPRPDFLARFGVYAVPAQFKAQHAGAYAKLQAAMLKARESEVFSGYISENGLTDLSIGKPGEQYSDAFDSSISAAAKLAN